MNSRRAWFLAALLGLVAAAIAAMLLWAGRHDARVAGVSYTPRYADAGRLLAFTELLSSDALEGRASGTPGNEAARGFILKRFETLKLTPAGTDSFRQRFPVLPRGGGEPVEGVNLLGLIEGQTPGQGPLLVVTAHFDHLGIRDGNVFNGADDNASGTAALIELAAHFKANPPRHDLLIAALDAEEQGLLGARALLRLPGIVDRTALNINLDMVSRSPRDELYVAGTSHTPNLRSLVTGVAAAAPVNLLMGHDTPDLGPGDWTLMSDHGPFHEAGIPFLYFGVEDHDGYHQPSDDFDMIFPDFFIRAVDTIIMAATAADADLAAIAAMRRAPHPSGSSANPE